MISHCRRLLATTTALVIASTAIAAAEPSAELIAAAKKEGMLTTIALPHDWCGYGDVIAAFKAKYPEITVNELNPDAAPPTKSKQSRQTRTIRARRRLTSLTSVLLSARR